MGRKVAEVIIPADDPGRDKGKKFRITEMPALQAERWAIRAITAIGKAGIEVPDEALDLGMGALAGVALRAIVQIEFDDAMPLLAEMMACVQRDMGNGVVRALTEDDIEEVPTILKLRGETIALHVGFSMADVMSRLRSGSASALPANSSDPATSPSTSQP
jgi:hypothetical protein